MIGLAPSFISIETGGRFQSPSVPSKSSSNLNSNESSFSHCDGVRWEQLSFTIAGRFALSYSASSISIALLVAFRVLIGFWASDVLCLSALVTLAGNVVVLDVIRSWFWRRHVFVSSRHVGPTRPTCRRHHVMSGTFFLSYVVSLPYYRHVVVVTTTACHTHLTLC